jgi:hypothetical protein
MIAVSVTFNKRFIALAQHLKLKSHLHDRLHSKLVRFENIIIFRFFKNAPA